jgi:hypothetical protein
VRILIEALGALVLIYIMWRGVVAILSSIQASRSAPPTRIAPPEETDHETK